MLFRIKNIVIFVVCISLFFCGYSGAATSEDDVARVGSVGITVHELKREMQRILPLNKSFHGAVSAETVKEVRRKAFMSLVERAYMVHYALANDISLDKDALEKRLQKVKARFKTKEALQKGLGKESIDAFSASVSRMLLAQKVEDITINSKAEVAEEELRDFYNQNSFMYQRPKQYRASHVLIKVDPTLVGEQREKLVAKAQDLADRALAGEDFFNLAYYHSDEDTKFVGGDIGYFHSGQVVNEFEAAIKELEPGDIVGPVETISGFHIIKLMDVQESRLLPFAEVMEKIKVTIEDKKRKELYDEWMTELKREVALEIIHPELKS